MRSREAEGPIVIELKYREKIRQPIITYHLAIDENSKGPFVAEEWLQWREEETNKTFRFLDFQEGSGRVVTGEMPEEKNEEIYEQLTSPEMLVSN